MKIKKYFFIIALAFALATRLQAADESKIITVADCALLLSSVAGVEDDQELYQPEVADQIICEDDDGEKSYRHCCARRLLNLK